MWEQVTQSFSTSLSRTAVAMAGVLPSVLAMLLIVLASLALAVLVRLLLRRVLGRLGFDRLLQRAGLIAADWPASRAPSLLAGSLAFWTVLLLGFALGLTAFNDVLAHKLALALIAFLPQVFAALAIFLAGLAISRFLERGSRIAAVNLQLRSASLLSLAVKWLVIIFSTAMALEHLGVGGHMVAIAFAILFGGVVFAVALAVGLGARDAVTKAIERELQEAERKPPEGGEVKHL